MSTALVVCGGGFQGLALVEALRAVGGQRVLVADWLAEHISRYSANACFRAPPLHDEALFIDFLLALCRNEAVTDLWPSTDRELALLQRHRRTLEQFGATVWVSDEPVLCLARDKRALLRWVAAEGLPSLPTFRSPHDPAAALPLIGKPVSGWGGRDILELHTAEDLASLGAAQVQSHVWQTLLREFDEYSFDIAVSRDGRVSPLRPRRRIRTLAGFAVLCEPFAPPWVTELVHQVVARLLPLGPRGMLNLQILVKDNQAWLSDLNARAGTSLALTLADGVNPVAFVLDRPQPEAPRASGHGHRTLRTHQARRVSELGLQDVAAVVFDLDDTLIDQKEWIYRKLCLLWESERASLPARCEFLQAMLQILEEGERARLFDVYAKRQGLDDALRLRLIDSYRQTCPQQCKLYPDVLGVLRQLRRQGYALGLVTDNPPASQRQKLSRTVLPELFDAMLLTGEIGQPKPSPAAFAEIARRLALPASRLVMVGDNLYKDSLGALRAGYAHAFHVERKGGFFNFHTDIARHELPDQRWTAMHDLSELHWYLSRDMAAA